MSKFELLKDFNAIRDKHSEMRYDKTHKEQDQFTFVFPSFTLPDSILKRRYGIRWEEKKQKNEETLKGAKIRVLFRKKHIRDLKNIRPEIHDIENITISECVDLIEKITEQINKEKYEAHIYPFDEPIVFSIFKSNEKEPGLILCIHENHKKYTNGLFSDNEDVIALYDELFNKMWKDSEDSNILEELEAVKKELKSKKQISDPKTIER